MKKNNRNTQLTEDQKLEAARLDGAITARNKQLAEKFYFYGCEFTLSRARTKLSDEKDPYDIGILVYNAKIIDPTRPDPITVFGNPGKSTFKELLMFYTSTHLNAMIFNIEVELKSSCKFVLLMTYQKGNKSFLDDSFIHRSIDGPMSFTRMLSVGIYGTDFIVKSARNKNTFTKDGLTIISNMSYVPHNMMLKMLFLTESEYNKCIDNCEFDDDIKFIDVDAELVSMIGCGNPVIGKSEIQAIAYILGDSKSVLNACVYPYDMYYTPTSISNYSIFCEPKNSQIIIDQMNKGILLAGSSWGITCSDIKYDTNAKGYSHVHIDLYDDNGYTNDDEFDLLMEHPRYIGETIFHNIFSDNDNLISMPGNMLGSSAKDYYPNGCICSVVSMRSKITEEANGMINIGYDIKFLPYLFAQSKADAIKTDMKRKIFKHPSRGFIKTQDIYYPYKISAENDKHDFTVYKSLHKQKVGKTYKYVYKAIVRMFECLTPDHRPGTMSWPIDDSNQRHKFDETLKEINHTCGDYFHNIRLTHLDKISVLVECEYDLPMGK